MTQETAAALLAENMNTVFAWALSRTGNVTQAQDLSSDIFVAVLASAGRLRQDDAFFGFLWQIAANTYKNYRRSCRRTQAHVQPLTEEVPSGDRVLESLCERESLSALRRELALLTEHYRECTVAYYFDGLSCAEIARRTGLSVGTVKQYLFKTRKILKEGIAMEREFGEKSFHPAPFTFGTIYNGKQNTEYELLFNRRLPGQILLAAYYVPMSVRELSVELGVASVYLEDEIDLLLKYNMLTKCANNKVQTRLLIFTKEFIEAQYAMLDRDFSKELAAIATSLRERLPAVRAIGFAGSDLPDAPLLWDLFVYILFNGIWRQERGGWEKLYHLNTHDTTTGLSYGKGYDPKEYRDRSFYSFAGTYTGDNGYRCSYVSFCSFWKPDNHPGCCMSEERLKEMSGKAFPEFTPPQLEQLKTLLEEVITRTAALMERITAQNVELLCEHSPEPLHELIRVVYPKMDLWEIMGWYGFAARQSGALPLPKPGEVTGIIGYAD